MSTLYWVNFYHQLGMTLAAGSATFAVIFFHVVAIRGSTSMDERRFMHIIYLVLRIGMIILFTSELLMLWYSYTVNNYLYWMQNPEVRMRWLLLTVVTVNALLMQYRKISMWIAPSVGASSWYAYFFFSVFVDIRWVDTGLTFTQLFIGYLLWFAFVATVLISLRYFLSKHYQKKQVATTNNTQASKATANPLVNVAGVEVGHG